MSKSEAFFAGCHVQKQQLETVCSVVVVKETSKQSMPADLSVPQHAVGKETSSVNVPS